jgi:hypothetical protein
MVASSTCVGGAAEIGKKPTDAFFINVNDRQCATSGTLVAKIVACLGMPSLPPPSLFDPKVPKEEREKKLKELEKLNEPWIIFMAYSGGRIVWSKDAIGGSGPLQTAIIDPKKIAKALAGMESKGLFDKNWQKHGLCVVDGAFARMNVNYYGKSIRTASSHELYHDAQSDLDEDAQFRANRALVKERLFSVIPSSRDAKDFHYRKDFWKTPSTRPKIGRPSNGGPCAPSRLI